MEQDKLVVAIDKPETGVLVNWTYVDLEEDDLVDKCLEIIIGVWGWSPEQVEKHHKEIEHFLLDPELWKEAGRKIKWPDTSDQPKGIVEAVERCKLRVYRAMKIHWSHDHVMRYAKRSAAHLDEALTVSGGK